MDSIAKEAFDYLNKMRIDPTIAIAPLSERLKNFKGNILQIPGQIALMTQEGPDVYKETIEFLKKQPKLPAMKWDDSLAVAARDHANDIGPKGIVGHSGSDGSTMTDRIERYGEWMGHVGENISFGQSSGMDVILQLIVDDGVPSRGHRTNCFKPDFKLVGIASGPHKQYKTTCVFDFAEEFTPNGNAVDAAQKQQQQQQTVKKPQQQQQQPQPKQQTQTQPKQQPQPKQQVQPKVGSKGGFGDDPNMPPNCIKVSTESETVIKNGKKHITVKKTYEMADGSTKQVIEQTIQG